MKKCVLLGLFFVLVMAVSMNLLAGNGSPAGMWKTIDDKTGEAKSIMKVWEENGVVYGKIEKLILKPGEDPNPLCDKCQGKFKNKPVLGMTIMWGLKKDDDEYSGGFIMDPDNGETYKCLIRVKDGGKKLEVRGYIGFSLIGRSQYWIKTQ